jgi:hypothetical protein
MAGDSAAYVILACESPSGESQLNANTVNYVVYVLESAF